MYSYGPPHMAEQKQDDQHEHTFSNYVRIRDVVQKTCQRRWTIGKSGERGSGISVLPARHDDDDDDYTTGVIYYLGKYATVNQFVECTCSFLYTPPTQQVPSVDLICSGQHNLFLSGEPKFRKPTVNWPACQMSMDDLNWRNEDSRLPTTGQR